MKEIVTIQVGNYSNYICSHFWNLQHTNLSSSVGGEAVNPSVLFRESNDSTSSKPQYTPRVQVIDGSGAFGALSAEEGRPRGNVSAFDEEAQKKACSSSWSGPSQMYMRESILPHRLSTPHLHSESVPATDAKKEISQGLSTTRNEVQFWSDYLTLQLHRRSCHSLQGVHHDVTDLRHFAVGSSLATSQMLDEIYDDLRFFIEECDNFGGLCFLANADDAFAGITTSYFHTLSDELGSTVPKILFSVHHPDRICSNYASSLFGKPFSPAFELSLSQNEARLVGDCIKQEIQYVPLSTQASMCMPLLQLDIWNRYQLSAPLGLAVDTALSALIREVSLSSLIASVRPSQSSLYSALFANVPPVIGKVAYERSVLLARGTTNLSNTWSSKLLGGISENEIEKWSVLADYRKFVTARGFSLQLPVSLSSKSYVSLPDAFPNVLGMTSLSSTHSEGVSNNAERVNRISMITGLVNDKSTASSALWELSGCIHGRAGKSTALESSELAELQEVLKAYGDDIAS